MKPPIPFYLNLAAGIRDQAYEDFRQAWENLKRAIKEGKK